MRGEDSKNNGVRTFAREALTSQHRPAHDYRVWREDAPQACELPFPVFICDDEMVGVNRLEARARVAKPPDMILREMAVLKSIGRDAAGTRSEDKLLIVPCIIDHPHSLRTGARKKRGEHAYAKTHLVFFTEIFANDVAREARLLLLGKAREFAKGEWVTPGPETKSAQSRIERINRLEVERQPWSSHHIHEKGTIENGVEDLAIADMVRLAVLIDRRETKVRCVLCITYSIDTENDNLGTYEEK